MDGLLIKHVRASPLSTEELAAYLHAGSISTKLAVSMS